MLHPIIIIEETLIKLEFPVVQGRTTIFYQFPDWKMETNRNDSRFAQHPNVAAMRRATRM